MRREVLPHYPVAVLGLPLHSLRVSEAAEAIEGFILSGDAHQVSLVNLNFWRAAIADVHLHRILAGCSMVVPDGMPLVWTAGLMGCPLAERVTGADLLPLLAAMSACKGYSIYWLGRSEEMIGRVIERLARDFPGMKISGIQAMQEEDFYGRRQEEVLERIRLARPDVLLVAFDNANQEKWIWMQRKRLGVPVTIGIRDAMETLSGALPRGPHWMQRSGLEWLIRCFRMPALMIPRYACDLASLLHHLPFALLLAWFQIPTLRRSSVKVTESPEAYHIHLAGELNAKMGSAMEAAVDGAIAVGRVVVVHLDGIRHVNAEGMGLLLDVRRKLLLDGVTLFLAGLNWRLRILFYGWCLRPLFDEWSPRRDNRSFGDLA